MLSIGSKVKIVRRTENGNTWQEMRNDKGMVIKGTIQSFSCDRNNHPIFARVLTKEDENLYGEELIAINSSQLKLVKCS